MTVDEIIHLSAVASRLRKNDTQESTTSTGDGGRREIESERNIVSSTKLALVEMEEEIEFFNIQTHGP